MKSPNVARDVCLPFGALVLTDVGERCPISAHDAYNISNGQDFIVSQAQFCSTLCQGEQFVPGRRQHLET